METSFTFTLSDNITYRRYNADEGYVSEVMEGRTMDIGQERDGWIPLVDENVRVRPGFAGATESKDPRIKWDGYGYIIEGFNVKCCGKVPYTLTFYSPQGYLYGDDKGDLKQGDKEYKNPYERAGYAVWRGQYLSQALYADDTRLWQNTKILTKPHHRAYLPARYPRACLPVPPVDLKDPTHWADEQIDKVPTKYSTIDGRPSRYAGDLFSAMTIKGSWDYHETEKRTFAYWDIPEEPDKGLGIEINEFYRKGKINSKMDINILNLLDIGGKDKMGTIYCPWCTQSRTITLDGKYFERELKWCAGHREKAVSAIIELIKNLDDNDLVAWTSFTSYLTKKLKN